MNEQAASEQIGKMAARVMKKNRREKGWRAKARKKIESGGRKECKEMVGKREFLKKDNRRGGGKVFQAMVKILFHEHGEVGFLKQSEVAKPNRC